MTLRYVTAQLTFFDRNGEYVEYAGARAPIGKCTLEELLAGNDDYLPDHHPSGYALVEPQDALPYLILPEVVR